jgi:hypothetical protein
MKKSKTSIDNLLDVEEVAGAAGAAVREAESCRMEDCKRRWKNKSSNDEKWLWCSYCDFYGICWKCGEMKSSKNGMRAHERKWRRK